MVIYSLILIGSLLIKACDNKYAQDSHHDISFEIKFLYLNLICALSELEYVN